MSKNTIMYYVKTARTSRLIYSLLESYGRKRNQALPTGFFVSALKHFGHQAGSVRQALHRMNKEGVIESNRIGRNSHIALTKYGASITSVGTRKLSQTVETEWDGKWTMISYGFASEDRDLRNQVKSVLDVQGFAPIVRGLYIHPKDLVKELHSAFSEIEALEFISIFRAERCVGETDKSFVMRLWDLEAINAEYERFVIDFERYSQKSCIESLSLVDRISVRFAFVLRFLEAAWIDPELPNRLLPRNWMGVKARRLSAKLYSMYQSVLEEFCDETIAAIPK